MGLGVKLNDIAPSVSAEVVLLLQQGRMALAATAIGAHVIGSLAMTLAGVASYTWLKAA